MRVLVLGSTGFVGRHAASAIARAGHEVIGCGRSLIGARHPEVSVDLSKELALERAGGALAARFDACLLLAGVAVPGAQFDERAAQSNVDIARHSFSWLAKHSFGARVIVMSSAHVYGPLGDENPIVESRALRPNGPYGESKLAVEGLAQAHAASLSIVIVRSFNQIGRAMPRGLFVPDLIESLRHGEGPITMKGADGIRDFLDVRDGARALSDLVSADVSSGSVFNLCSGHGIELSHLAAEMARVLGVDREVRFPSRIMLPFVGSRTALTRATGFEPKVALANTLAWIGAAGDEIEP